MPYKIQTAQKGISIVEVIVVAGIVAVFFSGLLASFYYTVTLLHDSRARQSALSVANNKIEFIRSLSYDAVGTVSGIPAGNIPQVATTTLNGIPFTITTLIEYTDDLADGVGASDANGITTDYKTAKVTVSWLSRGVEHEVFLLSRIIPRSIETDVGGGTIRVNVFDAGVQPLADASVRLINSSISPAIDITRETNAQGVALFGGAPAGAGYEVSVTKTNYSTDSTYPITTELVNPATPPATVAEADITTLNFFIDEVSTVTINTVDSITYEESIETFASSSAMVSSSGVVISGGSLELQGGSGAYVGSGSAILSPITPASLSGWGNITITDDLPASTARLVQVYNSDPTPILIPDTVLPGNSTGFSTDSIDISMLDIVTYSTISLGVSLESSDVNVTPSVGEIAVSYTAALTPLANVSLDISGNKIIGTRGDATPVYKYTNFASTDSVGELVLTNLEWDTYTITPEGYTIVEACNEHPLIVESGSAISLRLALESAVPHALRVVVEDSLGSPVSGAKVTLSRTGFNEAKETSPCGQVSFLPLSAQNDYQLSVVVGGLEVATQSEIIIEGNETLVIQLP